MDLGRPAAPEAQSRFPRTRGDGPAKANKATGENAFPPYVRGFDLMKAMACSLGDMQMTAAYPHNSVIASAAIAVEGRA